MNQKVYTVPFKVFLIYRFLSLDSEQDYDYYLQEIKEDYDYVFSDRFNYVLGKGTATYETHVGTFKNGSFYGQINGKEDKYPISPDSQVKISGRSLKKAWDYWKNKGGEALFELLLEELKKTNNK